MAPAKQSSKPSKGKELVVELGGETPSRLVSEQVEGGTSSSPHLDELSQIRKVQDQLIAAITNMSSKYLWFFLSTDFKSSCEY